MCVGTAPCPRLVLSALGGATCAGGLAVAACGSALRAHDLAGGGGAVAGATETVGLCAAVLGAAACAGGCAGARPLLRAQAGLLLVLTSVTMALAAYVRLVEANGQLPAYVELLYGHRRDYNGSADARREMDRIQTRLHCCGARSYAEWKSWYEFPGSCCPPAKRSADGRLCGERDVYAEGCAGLADKMLRQLIRTVSSIMVVMALLTFLTAGATLCITCC